MNLARKAVARTAGIAVCLAFAASMSFAQGRGGPPGGGGPGGGGRPGGPGGGGMGGGMGGGGMNEGMSRPTFPRSDNNGGPQSTNPRGQASENRPGVQLGPPGRWWDDKKFAKNVKLRPEQQARMDAIFEQNRSALLSRLEAYQQAQRQMEDLSRSSSPDEGALFAQIDRMAQARAELEKANTHMLLQLRKEMDADQLSRLENQR